MLRVVAFAVVVLVAIACLKSRAQSSFLLFFFSFLRFSSLLLVGMCLSSSLSCRRTLVIASIE